MRSVDENVQRRGVEEVLIFKMTLAGNLISFTCIILAFNWVRKKRGDSEIFENKKKDMTEDDVDLSNQDCPKNKILEKNKGEYRKSDTKL